MGQRPQLQRLGLSRLLGENRLGLLRGQHKLVGFQEQLCQSQLQVQTPDGRTLPVVVTGDWSYAIAFGAVAGFGIGNTVQSNSVADSVEAASRTLKQYSPESISGLVEAIVSRQVEEDQFSASNLTYGDVSVVKDIFKNRLQNIYHSRIEYPE